MPQCPIHQVSALCTFDTKWSGSTPGNTSGGLPDQGQITSRYTVSFTTFDHIFHTNHMQEQGHTVYHAYPPIYLVTGRRIMILGRDSVFRRCTWEEEYDFIEHYISPSWNGSFIDECLRNGDIVLGIHDAENKIVDISSTIDLSDEK